MLQMIKFSNVLTLNEYTISDEVLEVIRKMDSYISLSIELHLFFGRIMKEHALFLQAGFQCKDAGFIKTAASYRMQFEKLLEESIKIGGSIVDTKVIESGELVTPYTICAEKKTQHLTGIPINSRITMLEQQLSKGCPPCCTSVLKEKICMLNGKALKLVSGLINFKEKILREVNDCQLFTANYPLLIQHIIREAKLYQCFIMELERNGTICPQCMRDMEAFWNQIMMEHAMFIRGLLDPTEMQLIQTADDFAKKYALLLAESREKNDCAMKGLTRQTIETTIKYRDFKESGTKGISNCEISSIILPLLADHVLREANHYLRLLEY